MLETQICRSCGEDLPLNRFHKNNRTRLGVISICAPCRSRTRTDKGPVPPMEDRLAVIELSDLVRFHDHFEPDPATGCWVWQGSTQRKYPSFWHKKGRIRAHRFSLVAAGIPFDLSDEVHHACGRSLCVRPDHLVPMSPEEHRATHRELRLRNPRPRKTRKKRGSR